MTYIRKLDFTLNNIHKVSQRREETGNQTLEQLTINTIFDKFENTKTGKEIQAMLRKKKKFLFMKRQRTRRTRKIKEIKDIDMKCFKEKYSSYDMNDQIAYIMSDDNKPKFSINMQEKHQRVINEDVNICRYQEENTKKESKERGCKCKD